jgi:hypothetical protein
LLFGRDDGGLDDGELVPVAPEAAAIVFVAISLRTEIHTVFHDGKKLMKISETSYIYMAEYYPAMRVRSSMSKKLNCSTISKIFGPSK